MNTVTSVWIDINCIGCGSCAGNYPEIFSQPEEKAFVIGSVRVDGLTCDNETTRSPLNAKGLVLQNDIIEAVEGCPVESIRYSTHPDAHARS